MLSNACSALHLMLIILLKIRQPMQGRLNSVKQAPRVLEQAPRVLEQAPA